MKGTQTITLSQEAVAEAMADYLNKQIKHEGVISVGMINFERDGTLSVDFEDDVIPTATPAVQDKQPAEKGQEGWRGDSAAAAAAGKDSRPATVTTGMLQNSSQKTDAPRR